VKLKISELRKLIRQVLLESYGGALGIDPQGSADFTGFYPYEIERGVDIYSKWYKSPGESSGDPGRPADAEEYIGIKPKEPSAPEGAGETAA
jgi:hypothetical protein